MYTSEILAVSSDILQIMNQLLHQIYHKQNIRFIANNLELQIHMDWPSPLRNKGVFYVKREPKPLPEEAGDLLDHMTCGDIHPNSLGQIEIVKKIFHAAYSDHFCALVEEVVVPIFKNELNMAKFPQCVSDGDY